MNCQSCNTSIDYRFLTNCVDCGCAVEPAGLSEPNSLPDVQPAEPANKRLSWIRAVLNLAYLFASSVVGMIAGAVVVYYGAALVYLSIYRGVEENASVACSRGAAIAFLSIVVGAFLGTMGGSVFATKRPLCKDPLH